MDVPNMITIVQLYIAIRKDVEVSINPNQFQDPFNVMRLHCAYQVASQWMQENNVKIEKLNNN